MFYVIGFLEVIGIYEGKILFLFGVNLDYVKFDYCICIKDLFLNVYFVKIFGMGYWLYVEKLWEFE